MPTPASVAMKTRFFPTAMSFTWSPGNQIWAPKYCHSCSAVIRTAPLVVPIQRSPSNPFARQEVCSTGSPSLPPRVVREAPRIKAIPLSVLMISLLPRLIISCVPLDGSLPQSMKSLLTSKPSKRTSSPGRRT